MHLSTLDPRSIALAVVRPGGFWNWANSAWDTIWDPAQHLRPAEPMAGMPPILAALKTVPVPDALSMYTDAVAVMFTVDADGAPLQATDLQVLPWAEGWPPAIAGLTAG